MDGGCTAAGGDRVTTTVLWAAYPFLFSSGYQATTLTVNHLETFLAIP